MARLGGRRTRDGGTGYGGAVAPPSQRGYRPPAQRKAKRRQVGGGVKQRALTRLETLDGVQGVSRKGGITRPEARRVRKAWLKAGKPRPGRSNGPQRGYDPLQPLTGRSLNREVRALTNYQYGGQRRELDQQRRISDQTMGSIPGWYQEYERTIQENAARVKAANEQAQAAAYQQANTAASADVQAARALLQQQQASAAQRGATVDPEAYAALNQGAAGRQALGSSFGGMLAAQGQAAYTRAQDESRIGQGRKLAHLERERGIRFDIDKLGEDLAREAGDYRTKARGELREGERRYALERQAFGLDVAKAKQDVRESKLDRRQDRLKERRDRMEADRKYRLDREKFGEDVARDRYQRRHGLSEYKPPSSGGGSGGGESKYTRSQKNANQSEFRKARSLGGGLDGKPGDIIGFLVNKKSIDPLIARAAVAPGTLTKKQRAELWRMGIRVAKPTLDRPGNAPGPRGQGQRPT